MTSCSETPSRTITPTYADNLKRFIDYWYNDIECQVLRNNVNNLTDHTSNFHSYRYSLTPPIQNKLKSYMFSIDENSSIVDRTITYKLKDDLNNIINSCNPYTKVEGTPEDIMEWASDIRTSWFVLVASIQNLHACATAN